MTTIMVEKLSHSVGAEVRGLSPDGLVADDALAETILAWLEENGVLAFRDLHLEPEPQVPFCSKLGEIDHSEGHHPVSGIYRVSLDRTKNSSAEYVHATFDWHIDGCTPLHGECPQMATVLGDEPIQ